MADRQSFEGTSLAHSVGLSFPSLQLGIACSVRRRIQPQFDASLQNSNFLPDKWDPSQAPRLYYPGFDANGNRIAVDPVTGQTQPTAAGTIVPNSGNCARAGRGIVEIKRRSIFQGGYALAWATSADTGPMLASL